MKLAPLLAQYLYTNKKLQLAGIGTFLLDPSVIIEQESGKQNKTINPEGISFLYDPTLKDDDSLISFIASETGKMKALATSDLHSYLELSTQFLNIGKPFLLEGIGTLVKNQNGRFDFTPGSSMVVEKNKESPFKELTATSSNEQSFKGYNDVLKPELKFSFKKPILILLILAGIALALWGGFMVYKSSLSKNKINNKENKVEPLPVVDSSYVSNKNDSVSPQINTPAFTGYKFVLESSNKKRAFERFAKLKTYNWNVQIETKDSVKFSIFMVLPALAKDTLKIRDSLSRQNGRRVYIAN